MLHTLTIRDLALIEHAEISLADGLNVISGETGGGKSLVIAAIELLRGGRANSGMMRHGASELRVDGEFRLGSGERSREALVELADPPSCFERRSARPVDPGVYNDVLFFADNSFDLVVALAMVLPAIAALTLAPAIAAVGLGFAISYFYDVEIKRAMIGAATYFVLSIIVRLILNNAFSSIA